MHTIVRAFALLLLASHVPTGIAHAQAPVIRATSARTEWLLTASPAGIGVSRTMAGPVSVGIAFMGPALSVALGSDANDDADRLASAALTLDFAIGPVVWRLAPAAVVVSGNDWSQVYPGFHAGARTYVRLGRLDVAVGADLAGARIAGPNGSGTWRTWLAPLVGIRL